MKRQKKAPSSLHGWTIFCNTCIAGLLYHEYGAEFASPFINSCLDGSDFVEFCEHYADYLSCDPVVKTMPGKNYPTVFLSRIIGGGGGGVIPVRFIHDRDEKNVLDAWFRRCARVKSADRIAFILCDNSNMSIDDIKRFLLLPYNKKIVLVPSDRDDLPDDKNIVRVRGCRRSHFELTAFRGVSGYRYYHYVDWEAFFNKDVGHV